MNSILASEAQPDNLLSAKSEKPMLTKEQIEEIEARLKGITEPPWEVESGDDYFVVAPNAVPVRPLAVDNNLERDAICVCEASNQTEDCGEANTYFIANAPTDISALLASHKALEAEVESLREQLQERDAKPAPTDALRELRQQVEDTIAVARTEADGSGFITAYHFQTGAIHRLLAKAREGNGTTPRLPAFHHQDCGYKDARYNSSWECSPECVAEQENYWTALHSVATAQSDEGHRVKEAMLAKVRDYKPDFDATAFTAKRFAILLSALEQIEVK